MTHDTSVFGIDDIRSETETGHCDCDGHELSLCGDSDRVSIGSPIVDNWDDGFPTGFCFLGADELFVSPSRTFSRGTGRPDVCCSK